MAKIFQVSARAGMTRVVEPIARGLLRAGVTPNAVTVAGTVGVLVGALGFGARGHLVAGALIVTVFALTDLLDGTMARMSGGSTRFGAFLDSSMDRVADSAVFGAVAYWLATQGDHSGVAAALVCLAAGGLVSYVKARAEGLGMTCNVGIAERTERLLIVGVGGLLTGLGVEPALEIALWLLAAVSIFTVGQRMAHVYRQAQRQQAGVTRRDRPARRSRAAHRARLRRRLAAGPRAAPARRWPRAFRAGADRAHRSRRRGYGPTARQPAPGGRPGAARGRAGRRWSGAGCARTPGTGWRRSGCPSLSREQILAGFRLDGAELLAADVAAGRGAVVALPHAGNWDAAGAWVAATGWPITTVAERLKPEGVYERFLAFREGLGMEILPTHGGDAARRSTCWWTGCGPGTWCRCWPTGTCPPGGSRWTSSAGGPGCRPGRRCWRCAPARRSTWPRCGTNRTPRAPRSRARCRCPSRTAGRWTSGSGC